MSGTYERIDNQPVEHRCRRPGYWNRRWNGVGIGSIWRCGECGRRWMWHVPHLFSEPDWDAMDSHNFRMYGPPDPEEVLDKVLGLRDPTLHDQTL